MRGDCTDVTNTLVSMFRALGYPAKAVFGYVVDKTGAHVWGEVLIGGELYVIDDDGRLQPLEAALKDMQIFRPERGDSRDFMWDENGQDPYPHPPELAWWMGGVVPQAGSASYDAGSACPWTIDIYFWNVGALGGPEYQGATWTETSSVGGLEPGPNGVCWTSGTTTVALVFTGGPNGKLTFNGRETATLVNGNHFAVHEAWSQPIEGTIDVPVVDPSIFDGWMEAASP
jgi:hypothetical protein